MSHTSKDYHDGPHASASDARREAARQDGLRWGRLDRLMGVSNDYALACGGDLNAYASAYSEGYREGQRSAAPLRRAAEWLRAHDYYVGPRLPERAGLPDRAGFGGEWEVSDPLDDEDGYRVVGDSTVVTEAYEFLCDDEDVS